MSKALLALTALLLTYPSLTGSPKSLGASSLWARVQDSTAAPTATPTNTVNPVKPTAESQAKAKKVYGYDCALCHGENGDGKTDLAKDIGPLTDLSDPKTLAGKSDAELYDLIKNGKGKMPGEDGPRAKPDDLWNLVIYVRGLSKK